jgi:cytochrome c oxidase subunit II
VKTGFDVRADALKQQRAKLMGKWFAVLVVAITIASAIPIIRDTWAPPAISTHGHLIDEQLSYTMAASGFLFVAAQFMLAGFVWKFSSRTTDSPVKRFPGGAKSIVVTSLLLVGIEIFALSALDHTAWAAIYLRPAAPDAMKVEAQAGQFAYYFRYPGLDGKFGTRHSERIDESDQNFFGLDAAADPDSKDDIVSAELAIPANREIQLLMHAKDVGHSFYVRELRIQQDFVPGLDLSIHFTATKRGKYEIVCTQLCGLGHYKMRGYLQVLSQQDFDKWLEQRAAAQSR